MKKFASANTLVSLCMFFTLCATMFAQETKTYPVFGINDELAFTALKIDVTNVGDTTVYTNPETGRVLVVNIDNSWETELTNTSTGQTYRVEGQNVNDMGTYVIYDANSDEVMTEPLEILVDPDRRDRLLSDELLFLRLETAQWPRTLLGTVELDGNMFTLRVSPINGRAYIECQGAIRKEDGELLFLSLHMYGVPYTEPNETTMVFELKDANRIVVFGDNEEGMFSVELPETWTFESGPQWQPAGLHFINAMFINPAQESLSSYLAWLDEVGRQYDRDVRWCFWFCWFPFCDSDQCYIDAIYNLERPIIQCRRDHMPNNLGDCM